MCCCYSHEKHFADALLSGGKREIKDSTEVNDLSSIAGFLNLWPWPTSESRNNGKGPRPDLVEIEHSRFLKFNVLIENVGSSSATNVIVWSLVIMFWKLLQHGNLYIVYHIVRNMQLLKAFWGRQMTLVGIKTKFRRLNVEDDFICVLSRIEPRIFIVVSAFPLGRVAGPAAVAGFKTQNTSQSTAIWDSSAGFTPRRNQARSEIRSLHLVFRWTLGRFPMALASRACFARSFPGHSGHMVEPT